MCRTLLSFLIFSVINFGNLDASNALSWKLKGPELDCSVTCGLGQAVKGPSVGNSTYSPYACAVNGSTFGTYSTGVQVGTAIYVSNVLSCWVYSDNPGGPSATSHSSYSCLCSDGDVVSSANGSTAQSCTSSCSATNSSSPLYPLTACQQPTIEPICYATEQRVFGYQNATSGASDQSCLAALLPEADVAQALSPSRLAAFTCLCATQNASASAQLASNCSTSSTSANSILASSPTSSAPAVSPAAVPRLSPAASGAVAGAIAGGTIGAVIGAALLAGFGYFAYRMRRRRLAAEGTGIGTARQTSTENPFKKPEAQFSIQVRSSTHNWDPDNGCESMQPGIILSIMFDTYAVSNISWVVWQPLLWTSNSIIQHSMWVYKLGTLSLKSLRSCMSITLQTSTQTSGGTLPFDLAVAQHKADLKLRSQEKENPSSSIMTTDTTVTTLTPSSGKDSLPLPRLQYMRSEKFVGEASF